MRFLIISVVSALTLLWPVLPAAGEGKQCEKFKTTVVKGVVTKVCTKWSDGTTGLSAGPKTSVKPGPPPPPVPIPGCATPVGDPTFCLPKNSSGVVVNVPATAASAALSLQIPEPTIKIGPDPARNKWNMIPIGFPLWIWTTEPDNLHAVTTEQGITITMTATQGPTTVTFGDGTTITCRTMTPRAPFINPPPPSPDCGHTYRDKANYTISATTTWNIHWEALGFSGTTPITRTGTAPLRVGELSTVLVQGP